MGEKQLLWNKLCTDTKSTTKFKSKRSDNILNIIIDSTNVNNINSVHVLFDVKDGNESYNYTIIKFKDGSEYSYRELVAY